MRSTVIRTCCAPRCARADAADGDAQALRARVASARRGGAPGALLAVRRDAGMQRSLALLLEAARADELTPRGSTDALWAAGALSSESGALGKELDVFAAAVTRTAAARALPPHCAADAAWALAQARHSAPQLFLELAGCAREGWQGAASARTHSTLIWASAVLCEPAGGPPGAPVTEALVKGCPALCSAGAGAAQGLAGWSSAQLALTLWSLACAEGFAWPAFDCAWRELCGRDGGECAQQLPQLALCQLAQAALDAAHARAHALPPLPDALGDAAQRAWRSRCDARSRRGASTPSSAAQADVGRVLRSLGRTLHAEAMGPGGYTLDWAIQVVGQVEPTLLEYDGSSHFARNAPRPAPPLGATRLKRRHLRDRGACLVVVPHWEWEALTGATQRQRYLRDLLATVEQ